MKTKTILLFFIAWIMSIQPAIGGEVYDYITYFGFTEESVTVAWDPVVDAERYEFKAHHIEHDVDIAIGTTTHPTSQMVVVFPRSGHYRLMVRACRGEDICSIWAESTNDEFAVYNGEPQGWWVYRHISPAGSIVVE